MKLFGTLRELVAAVFRKDGHEITLRPNQTSSLYTNSRAVSLPQVDNDVVLTASGYIANADIAAAAGIVDSKLATISTAGKVSNSATTATDANTASAIVARDAGGNFSAGTITASLSGNASTATTATNFSGSLSGEVTGTQSATVVASGVIDNDNISATAGIVDTKLATIATAGKVSNSATTATSANTASAIVARDGSGNFSAGTVSASGVNVSGLTVSRAVVTDGSKNLASLEYTTAATGSTLMSRDISGNTTVNTLFAGSVDVTGLATMDKAYIDGSSGNGFIEFEGQTVGDITAPTTGEARLFAGTDGKIYVRKKGSAQAEELGAGGSGEVNLVDNPSDAGNWGVVNATATTNTTAANNPLSGVIDTSVAIASSTNGGYARYRFTMPSALKQRKLKLEWYQIASSLASGAYKVEVWTNASSDYSGAYTELSLSTDSSGTSSIPNLNGKYSSTFDTNGSDYYEIRIVRTAASAATIYIANVVCGPGIQPQGAVVEEWKSYTPTGSWTTNTTYTGRYRRVGDSAEILVDLAFSGAPAGSTYLLFTSAQILNGLGLSIDTSKLPNTVDTTLSFGTWTGLDSGINGAYGGWVGFDGTNIQLGYQSGATAVSILSTTGPVAWNTGDNVSFRVTLPISQWAGSGTVQLAQNDVEYASNSSTSDANETSSFAYGPDGSDIPSITAAAASDSREKRIRFQTPIQAGDRLSLEVRPAGTNTWIPLEVSGDYVARMQQNTGSAARFYGVGLARVSGSSTDVSVYFGRAGATTSGTTYGATGTNYPATAGDKWRVRKQSAGAAVGFGIVSPGTSAGLVSAAGLPGNTTGNAIASGYVGQKVTWATPPSGITASTTESDWTNATIVLDQGVWLIQANLVGILQTGTTAGNDVEMRVRITDSANTTIQNFEKFSRIQTAANAITSLGITMGFSGVQVVTAAATTYKIRVRRVDNNGSNSCGLYNSAGVYSEFFAIRIA